MPTAADPYATLGVPRTADADEIKRAFRALAKSLHPDVVGDDPARLERFKQVREAYETLSDPDRRARWDRLYARPDPGFGRPTPRGKGNDLDLDDIFADFGKAPEPRTDDFGFGRSAAGRTRAPRPQPGRDVHVSVDVPEAVARAGGTVTVRYQRVRRADRTAVLGRYEEIHDLRVPPGTAAGAELRVPKLGDAGVDGGPPGDLVCSVRVVGATEAVVPVEIGVGEAVLGGQVRVVTPTGPVRISVPPGTSSGARLRIRGRGAGGGDVLAEVRIVVPRSIDEESRRLMQRFAELNPHVEEG